MSAPTGFDAQSVLDGLVNTMNNNANAVYASDLQVFHQAFDNWVRNATIDRDNGLPLPAFGGSIPARQIYSGLNGVLVKTTWTDPALHLPTVADIPQVTAAPGTGSIVNQGSAAAAAQAALEAQALQAEILALLQKIAVHLGVA